MDTEIKNNLKNKKENISDELKTAKIDRIFKAIMLKNLDILEAIISQAWGEEVKILKLLNSELTVRNTEEKVKTVDVLIETKNKLKINLELNTSNSPATRVRNMHFLTSFYSQQTKRGDKYDTETTFAQINLNYNAESKEEIVERYNFRTKDGKVREVNLTIVDVNMDKLMEACYDNPEKLKDYKYLHMLDIADMKELDKLCEGDVVMEKYKNKLEELNDNHEFVWDYEEDSIRLHNTEVYLAKKEGAIEIAKKMLAKGETSKYISEITNLSEEEINKLKQEIDL